MERKRKHFFSLVLLIKRTKIPWVTWKYSVLYLEKNNFF